MAAEKGLDVDNLSGRALIKSKLWPNGVMYYEIDSSLCKYLDLDLFLKFEKLKEKKNIYTLKQWRASKVRSDWLLNLKISFYCCSLPSNSCGICAQNIK